MGAYKQVGVAQQWYDDLDNLAFSTPESESEITSEDSYTSDVKSEDGRMHIDCAVNTSPGTSEVRKLLCYFLYKSCTTRSCSTFLHKQDFIRRL